ncbi:ABC transporter permease [Sediminispirochaeta bajacaliforniensis]|uniref:ABC transporter permease n=1 Tax=Sediminispirochaeta bajacaliforniensis TaxID=148 RepID=UPI0003791F16|nr:ABC transporter permease [Sediminispirochaeta bajacaliforniensis]
MNLPSTVFVAWRLLNGPHGSKNRRRHVVGAIIGVAFSLIPLIVVQQVSSGMIEGISRRFLEIGSFHLQVKRLQDGEPSFEKAAEDISRVDDVLLALPMVEGVGIVYSPDGRSGVSVRGLPPDWLEKDRRAASFLSWSEGAYRLNDKNDLLISKEAARTLNVVVGDEVTLLTAYKIGGLKTVMKPSHFVVRGIFSTGYYELDALSIYIPYKRALSLFPDSWSSTIGVKIHDPFGEYQDVKQRISQKLPENWRVYSWYELQRPMFESFKTTRTLLVFIMILIVMVASVSITAAVVMMMMEHEPEIAMLKSTGVSSRSIEQMFLGLGMGIGIVGTIIGIAGGLLISININTIISGIETGLGFFRELLLHPLALLNGEKAASLVLFNPDYYLETIPIDIHIGEVLYAAIFALSFATIGSWLPARKAARLKPLDIFRKH